MPGSPPPPYPRALRGLLAARDGAGRARLLGQAVREALARAQAPAASRLPGREDALAAMAAVAEAPAVRDPLCAAALAEPQRPWARLRLLARLAPLHGPARAEALARVGAAPSPRERRRGPAQDREEAAWLVRLEATLIPGLPPAERPARVRALAARAGALADASLTEALLLEVLPSVVAPDPEPWWALLAEAPVLDRARLYAAAGHALAEGPARARAAAELLACARRPAGIIEGAPLLRAAQLPRALELAAGFGPGHGSGASALRALLPRLAALVDPGAALERARAIGEPGERGTALGLIAPLLPDGRQEEVLLEGLAAIDATPAAHDHGPGPCLARLAPALAPLGWVPWLLQAQAAASPEGMAALVAHATMEEAAPLVPRLCACASPEALCAVRARLAPAPLLPRWLGALESAAAAGAEQFLDDDGGDGFGEWCPLGAALAGDAGLLAIAAALSDGG